MNDRESRGVTLLTGTAQVLGAPAAKAASCSGADRAQRASRVGNCSGVPGPKQPDSRTWWRWSSAAMPRRSAERAGTRGVPGPIRQQCLRAVRL